MQLKIELSEWMKATIRSSSEPYLGIITWSWAWLQIASLKATQYNGLILHYHLWRPSALPVHSIHAPSTKTLHRNKSKMYQNIPDGQLHTWLGSRNETGGEGSDPSLPRYRITRPSAKWTRNAPCATFERRQFQVVWPACPEVHICARGDCEGWLLIHLGGYTTIAVILSVARETNSKTDLSSDDTGLLPLTLIFF